MQHIIDEYIHNLYQLNVDMNFIKVLFKNTIKRNLLLIVNNLNHYKTVDNIILSIFQNTSHNWNKYTEYKNRNPNRTIDYTKLDIVYPTPDFKLTVCQINGIINYLVNSLGFNAEYISRTFFLAGFEHKDRINVICDILDWFFMSKEMKDIESKNSASVLDYFMLKPDHDNDYLYSILNDWR